jgi:SP family xylose:H+ symportor-like MFS transporter
MGYNRETGSKTYLYCICGVAVIGGLLFGYDTAVISGGEKSLQKFFRAGINGGEDVEKGPYGDLLHGFVVSAALVGCVIGALISGVMSDRIGRRNSLIVSSVLFFLSALGSYMPEFLFRSNFSFYQPAESNKGLMWAFILYRVLGGVGVGMASALCPVYIAEVAPAEIRGILVSCNQFAIIFGQLLVYAINTFIRNSLADTAEKIERAMITIGWRRMFVSEAVPAALFGILLLFVPKTPRFLVLKGKEEKATEVLTHINGEQKAKEIIQEIKDTIENEETNSVFSYGWLVIIVGCLLSFFQQAVGINVVLYYAPRIFENMHFSGDASMLQTVLMGCVNLIFTIIAIFTVDKFGRKPLLMGGSIGMAIGMIALSLFFKYEYLGFAALVFIIIYTASFMYSWGPCCWVLISEIFPNTIRGSAVAIAVAVQWISNLVVSTTFPKLNSWNSTLTYLMYGIFSILSAVFVYFMVPETKRKTLEDIEEIWLEKQKKNQLPK